MNPAIELLSLPRRTQLNYRSMEEEFGSGLPINSLPGWELIPLNSKLPMLKCPGHQVIFSKDKIGQSLLSRLKHDFDTSAQEKIPEYNPLHDLNLRNFYGNENNLKRLRVNGEITENNDVICTLKDFNEYRQQIHRSYIYYMLQEMRRLNAEQIDRKLINYASNVTGNDYANINLRKRSYHQIVSRRQRQDEERMHQKRVAWERVEQRFQEIAARKQMEENLLQHKKYLHELKMKQHTDARDELDRKKLIHVKNLSQFKKQRFQRAVRKLMESKNNTNMEKEAERWERRLHGRIAFQQYINRLYERKKENREIYIQSHMAKYSAMWAKIQMQIRERSSNRGASGKKKKKKVAPRSSLEYISNRKMQLLIDLSPSASDETLVKNRTSGNRDLFQFKLYDPTQSEDLGNRQDSESSNGNDSKMDMNIKDIREMFNNMLDEELCKALNKAIDIQGNTNLPFDKNDPTYKVAQFIVNNIIKTFNGDLTQNHKVLKILTDRVLKFFNEVRTFILYRSSQIIAESHEGPKDLAKNDSSMSKRHRPSHVSFSRFSSTIGISSYAINPHVNLRNVKNRKPTPAGSLASILAAESQDVPPTYNLPRTDIVFLEYYHVKFKRELIVNIGTRVFAAIQRHFAGETTVVRKEFLELDKHYLADMAAKAILGHAVNEMNYLSAVKFCSSALTADIIWSLQRQLLKPERDAGPKKKQKTKDWLCLFYECAYKEDICCMPNAPTEGLFNKD